METNQAIGEAIRRNRVLQNQDKKDLAEKAGISPKHLKDVEQGANVTIETLEKIAQALGTTINKLIHDAEKLKAERPVNYESS